MMSFVNVICFQKKLSCTLWSLFSVRLFTVFFELSFPQNDLEKDLQQQD